MRDSSTRRFASDSAANLLQQVWAVVISIFTSIIVVRGLGLEERGVYAVVILITSLTSIFINSGLESAFIYQIARDPGQINLWAKAGMALTLWASLVAVASAGFILWAAHDALFPGIAPQDLWLSLLLIPVTLIATNIMSIFRGAQDFRSYNRVEILTQPVVLVASVLFIWVLHGGLVGAAVAIVLRYVAAIVFTLVLLRRKQVVISFSLRVPLQQAKPLLSYGIRAYLYSVVTFLNLRLDVFLLNLLGAGVSAIGLYDVAVTLGERMWLLSRSVSQVTFARSAAFEQADAQRTRLTLLAARYVFWLGLAFALVVYVLAEWGVRLLYGDDYLLSAAALRLLLPGIVLFGMGLVLSNDIAGRGKPEITAVQSLFAALLNVALNLFLIPRLSIAGAALASSISYPFQTLLLIFTFCRLSGTAWWRLFVMTGDDVRLWRNAAHLILQRLRR